MGRALSVGEDETRKGLSRANVRCRRGRGGPTSMQSQKGLSEAKRPLRGEGGGPMSMRSKKGLPEKTMRIAVRWRERARLFKR